MAQRRYITVRAGDRLDTLAKRAYGDATQYRLLVLANPRLNVWKPQPGLRLEVPRA